MGMGGSLALKGARPATAHPTPTSSGRRAGGGGAPAPSPSNAPADADANGGVGASGGSERGEGRRTGGAGGGASADAGSAATTATSSITNGSVGVGGEKDDATSSPASRAVAALVSSKRAEAEAAAAAKRRGTGDAGEIIIHVFDEARGSRKDFTCDLPLLYREMRYFQSHLSEYDKHATEANQVEMSVHCDIAVFSWLLDYVKASGGRADVVPKGPELTTANCVPILISSDFLQMDRLVDECLAHISQHVMEVVRQPLDMSCLAEHLLRRLAAQLTEDTLELLRRLPEKDATTDPTTGVAASAGSATLLVSKLYRLKLEQLLEAKSATTCVARCAACGRLYSAAARSKLVCPRARVYVDFNGEVIARHVPMRRGWDLKRHLSRLRARRHTWREIYWHLWGVLHVLPRCTRCRACVPASELAHCVYHPAAATFDRHGCNDGTHPCCGAAAVRFDSTAALRVTGCRAREHVLKLPDGASFGSLAGGRGFRNNGDGRRWRDDDDDVDGGDGGVDGGVSAVAEWEAAQWVLGVLRRHYSLVVEPYSHSPPPGVPGDGEVMAAEDGGERPLGVENGIFLARDHYALGGVDVLDEVAAMGDASSDRDVSSGDEEEEEEEDDVYDYDSSDGDDLEKHFGAPLMRVEAERRGDGGRFGGARGQSTASDDGSSDTDDSSDDATSDDDAQDRPINGSNRGAVGRSVTVRARPGSATTTRGRAGVKNGGGRAKKTAKRRTAKSAVASAKAAAAAAAAAARRSRYLGLSEETYNGLAPHLQRHVRQEAMKEDDHRRVAMLISRLQACRREGDGEANDALVGGSERDAALPRGLGAAPGVGRAVELAMASTAAGTPRGGIRGDVNAGSSKMPRGVGVGVAAGCKTARGERISVGLGGHGGFSTARPASASSRRWV